jgi:hypothetical protein
MAGDRGVRQLATPDSNEACAKGYTACLEIYSLRVQYPDACFGSGGGGIISPARHGFRFDCDGARD